MVKSSDWLPSLLEQWRLADIKRRLKKSLKRKPRPARVIPPKEKDLE